MTATSEPDKEPADDAGPAHDSNACVGDPYGYWDGPVYRHDYRGAVIWCRDKKLRGVSTGEREVCDLEGCTGEQIYVLWDDGDHSWSCIKALEQIGPNEFKHR